MLKKTTLILAIISSSALLSSGCNPQLGGQEGNLSLSYDKGPIAGAVGSSPLAVGAQLAYSVSRKDDNNQKLSFDSAISSDDSLIAVSDVEGARMTLEAFKEGQVTVDVEAAEAGDLIHDSFKVASKVVDSLSFDHLCAPGEDAAYLVDQDIRLKYTMRAGSATAVGYGYYPVEIKPEGAAEVGTSTRNGLLPLHTGTSAGPVEITSTLGEEAFSINLVEASEIQGLMLHEEKILDGTTLPVEVDKNLTLHVLPLIEGDVPVCQSDSALDITVNTPQNCEVTYGPNPDDTDTILHLYEPNNLKVKGLAEGTCEFTITMPEAADGAGVSLTHSLEVRKKSDGGNSDDDGSPQITPEQRG